MNNDPKFHDKTVKVIHGKVEYYKNQVDINENKYNLSELNTILHRLRLDYEKFEENQTLVEILAGEGESQLHGQTRCSFEQLYFGVESKVSRLIDERTSVKSKNVNGSNNNALAEASPLNYPLTPMSSIDLPKFDGRFESWINFRLVYTELVHENNQVSPILKFQYLRNALKGGSAEHFIDNISASCDNYKTVWDALHGHYENDTRLKYYHMDELYNLQPIKYCSNLGREIQVFVAKFWKHYNTLQSIDVPVQHWDLYLTHHICQLVDQESLKQIELKKSATKLPSVKEVLDILSERARLLETLSQKRQTSKTDVRPSTFIKPKFSDSKRTHNFVVNDEKCICIYCKSQHSIISCSSFSNLPWSSKNDFVIQHKLCRKCFGNHFKNNCKAKNCKICNYPHHTILHCKRDSNISNTQGTKDVGKVNETPKTEFTSQTNMIVADNFLDKSINNSNCFVVRNSQVLLPNAIIWVYNSVGTRVPCNALIDPAAQSNFITENLCQVLNLKIRNNNWAVSGIGGSKCMSKHCINVNIESRISHYKRKVDCLVLSNITGNLPERSFKCDLRRLPKFKLGDPEFYVSKSIDLLLGAEIYSEIIFGEKVNFCNELPPFMNSEFGYIVCGKISNANEIQNVRNTNALLCCDNAILDKNIQKFWQVENITTQNNFSLDEKACEKHYVENVSRDQNGRFIVALPFKKTLGELGDSKRSALRQFYNLENRLTKNPDLYRKYSDFMDEYIQLNHMTAVDSRSNENSHFFLPHHPVFKESSSTTKLRVVFNASSSSSSGISLNDTLLTGPTIQPDLMALLLNFRTHQIALTADIAKMYRQVTISEKDRKYQQIFWRQNLNDPLTIYQLNTVTYGMASAPFLAIRSLKQLAIDECDKYPKASSILLNNFYVDDLMTGCDSKANAIQLKTELSSLLRCGGFDLRKWVSNDKAVVPIDSDLESNVVTTLGVIWDSIADSFQLPSTEVPADIDLTKRSVLAQIAKLFDPLGLIAPVIFHAKYFMQLLWSIPHFKWDDNLFEPYLSDWLSFASELKVLKNLTVPRCIISCKNSRFIELHGFGDASEKGYGACIYIRSLDKDNNWQCRLLCGKSRVAPLKKLTIPRLELTAALFLAQLYEKVRDSINIKFSKVQLWTDSTITLYRINSSPAKYATFVANRVSQIQDIAQPALWFYIPTELNPADIVSRGLMPSELDSSRMWWNGPSFLNGSNKAVNFQHGEVESEDPELIKMKIALNTLNVVRPFYETFDNYDELIRVYAYAIRFFKHTQKIEVCDNLTIDELDNALKCIIRSIQTHNFSEEIRLLNSGQTSKQRNKQFAKLCPYVDSDGLLRVGGRLTNSSLKIDQRHPFLLPANNHFCKLLVKSIHLKNLHVGPNALISFVRQRFWILSLRKLCKNTTYDCIRCYRTKPKSIHQLMGQLPIERLESFKVFENVGIDLCGPFFVSSKIRCKVTLKAYICLFICFSTKACHLEVVDDLSTKSFLMALQRFIGRRSTCSNIFSDNGTNFVGAKNELADLVALFNKQEHKSEVFKFCTTKGINWKTIPARSPHFGGLWEAAIKSAKYLLKRQLGNYKPTLEELQTLVVQVEACLNSRPLTPLSNDPSDLSVLTPGHFLVGKPLNALPEPSIMHLTFNRLTHYQRIVHTLQVFWSRWSLEYLSTLQERNKWLAPQENIKIGVLVLLKEDHVPPLKWIMGRVIEVHPGTDGIVRVVTVKTATGSFKRAITRICVLPVNND